MKKTDERIERTEIDVTDRKNGLQRGVPALLEGRKVVRLNRSWLGPVSESRAKAGKETGLETKYKTTYEVDGVPVHSLSPSDLLWALNIPTRTTAEVADELGLSISQVNKAGTRHQIGIKIGHDIRWTERDIEKIRERIGKRGRPAV